jgi:hypothetical protein
MLKEIPVVEQRYQAVLAVLEHGLSVTPRVERRHLTGDVC